jgi:hypothetical protein
LAGQAAFDFAAHGTPAPQAQARVGERMLASFVTIPKFGLNRKFS